MDTDFDVKMQLTEDEAAALAAETELVIKAIRNGDMDGECIDF